jgi:hypothetical protein
VIEADSPRRGAIYVEQTERVCTRCGALRPLDEFARDRSRPSGRKGMCKRCDAEKSLARYRARRGEQPTLSCSECGAELMGRQRVVCSGRCRERRFKRLHPESYAARETRKVERRRGARQRAGDATRAGA